jgi:hypothetical protein
MLAKRISKCRQVGFSKAGTTTSNIGITPVQRQLGIPKIYGSTCPAEPFEQRDWLWSSARDDCGIAIGKIYLVFIE